VSGKRYSRTPRFTVDLHSLRLHRRAAGFTCGELARALGVTESTISAWESGRTQPVGAVAQRVVEFWAPRGWDVPIV
jgi:DNA-binding transcriptional regulator YiaG